MSSPPSPCASSSPRTRSSCAPASCACSRRPASTSWARPPTPTSCSTRCGAPARRRRDRHPDAAHATPTRGSAPPRRSAPSTRDGRAGAFAVRQGELCAAAARRGASGVGYLLKDRVMEPQGFAEAVRRWRVEAPRSIRRSSPTAGAPPPRRPGRHPDPARARGARPDGRGPVEPGDRRGPRARRALLERQLSSIFDKLELPVTAEGHRRVLAVLTYLRAQED